MTAGISPRSKPPATPVAKTATTVDSLALARIAHALFDGECGEAVDFAFPAERCQAVDLVSRPTRSACLAQALWAMDRGECSALAETTPGQTRDRGIERRRSAVRWPLRAHGNDRADTGRKITALAQGRLPTFPAWLQARTADTFPVR